MAASPARSSRPFGRPARDTGLESERNHQPSEAQILFLLNASEIQQRIERGPRLRELAKNARGRPAEIATQLFLLILSRRPAAAETAAAARLLGAAGLPRKQALDDLVWVLINGKEFSSRH